MEAGTGWEENLAAPRQTTHEKTKKKTKRLAKGNSIKAEACEGKFHQGRGLQREIPSRQRLAKGNSIKAEACKGKFHQGRGL